MKRFKIFWAAHPAQALLEPWLVGLLILFPLSLQVGMVDSAVLFNGLLFLRGASGLWAVFRVRVPEGSWPRQVLWELGVGLSLSLVMTVGLRLPARLMGWESIWLQSNLKDAELVTMLFLAIGLGYLLARPGVRLWLLWQHLRQRRMLWAITHAHLMLVVVMACLAALFMFLTLPPLELDSLTQPESVTLWTLVTERLMHTVFPALMVFFVMTLMTLFILLPPSALFSFLVARRTTRRLEALVAATRTFRQGQYEVRVQVEGEDEVAELQQDFNAMAGELERTLHDLRVQRDRVTELLQARRALVANVSHELRTPVATVRASLESTLNLWPEIEPADLRHDLEVMAQRNPAFAGAHR